MTETLLSIVQKVCGRLSLAGPAAVINNADQTTATMLALVQEEGEELSRAFEWSTLIQEGATISLVAGQELYPLPADFDRLVGGTTWDRNVMLPAIGPDSPQVARARREQLAQTPVNRITFRQVGNQLRVWPIPTVSGALVAFDYVSGSWCASAAGTPQSAWAADTDMPTLPGHLFIQGLRLRWLQLQGFDFQFAAAQYASDVKRARQHDVGGGGRIQLDRKKWNAFGNADGIVPGPAVVVPANPGTSS